MVATRVLEEATDLLNVLEHGVLAGPRANDTERTANTTAFNNAVDEAHATGKVLYVPAAQYQIKGAIRLPNSGFRWFGTTRSFITQYQLNVPVIHIGTPYGAGGSASTEAFYFSGACLKYSGTGTAGARALEFTGAWMSVIEHVDIGDVNSGFSGRVSVPFEGLSFDGTNGNVPPFSNVFRNIRIKHFGWRGINAPRPNYDGASTGSTWENIYVSGGDSAGQQDLTLNADGVPVFFQMTKQLILRNFNVEWTKAPCAVYFANCGELNVTGLNIEGVSLKRTTSGEAGFVEMENSRGTFDSCTFYDNRVLTSNNISKARLFRMYDGSSVKLGDYSVELTTKTTAPGTPELAVVSNMSSTGNSDCEFAFTGKSALGDQHNLNFFDKFAYSSGSLGGFMTSLVGFNNSTPCGMPNADQTLYVGSLPGILIANPSGATRKYTFSKYYSATDSTVIPRGTMRTVVREGGTNNLVVANHDGNGIATLTSAGASCDIVWNESNWILARITGGTAGGGGGSSVMQPFGLGTHWNATAHYPKWAEAGVQWLRMDMAWDEVEATQGVFDWGKYDNAMSVAQGLGLKVLWILGYTPTWARSGPGTHRGYCPAEAYDGAWMNYINQCVTRYGSTADAWEICNEPNHDYFFVNGTGSWASNNLSTSPQDKKRQQYKRQVGQALTQAGIASKVLTTSGWADGGDWDSGFTAWLAGQAGFLPQFSILSVHGYGWPSYSLLQSEPANRHAEGVTAGITWNDIWCTEHGIHDSTGGGDAADKTYLIRSYAYALQQPRVKKLFWFQGSWDPDHQNLLSPADVRTARFYAYKLMTEKWAGATQFVSFVNGNVRGTIANLASGSRMAILWCDSGTPAINSLGLNVASAWNQDGTSISLSTGIGSAPVFVALSD